MRYPSVEEAERFLSSLNCPAEVVAHSRLIAAKAKHIGQNAARVGVPVDLPLVTVGALLHDCGQVLLKQEGGEPLQLIECCLIHSRRMVEHSDLGDAELRAILGPLVESHVGPGLAAEDVRAINEAQGTSIPVRDYLPQTLEAKILCYAGMLFDGVREMSYRERLEDQLKTFGAGSGVVRRSRALHDLIGDWAGQT
jgi:uncharacterized protein